MTAFTAQVAASADDAHAGSITNDSGRTVTACTNASITSAIGSPGSHGSNDEYSAGGRMVLNVPQGATINSCTAILTAQGTYASGGTVSFLVSAVATDSGIAYTTATNRFTTTTRPRTTAVSSAWNQNSVTADVEYSISIATVVQEIVNRASWVSGNYIDIVIDTNTTCTQGEWQDYHFYDGSTTKCLKLSGDYTAAGGGSSIIPITLYQRRQRL